MPFDLGATARLTAECRDPDGTPATAATATVTIGLPDGTTASPVATEGDTGEYTADYVTAQAGRHTVRWVFTGPAHAYTDMFDVRPSTSTAIMSLAEAKKHLTMVTDDDDDEVRHWVDATTQCVEYFVGPVVVRTVTERHTADRVSCIALRERPALELVSVAGVLTGGMSYEPDTLSLDGDTGLVSLLGGGILRGPLDVTYRAGRRIVTANITGAARIILQHLWRTRQGPGRPQMGVGDFDVTEPIPGLGYAIPNRAMQLLNPDNTGPGMA
ncbi:hypothetical protein [Streptomyces sp. NBC_00306]|uniref:hypothetical protein n=1 Tax=Streptomyces sp. NBC_00306 TaxID=2975708 RepID=UPI002E2E6427|nr:hypothetical protein [Streptomyces sp. NBC_00306]